MPYLVQDLKTDLEAILHGTTLSKVTAVNPLIDRAAREVLLDADFYETKREAQIVNALYDKVYNYIAPTDLKSDKVFDIRPQVNRTVGNELTQTYSQNFDIYKGNTEMFQVEYVNGIKTLRISQWGQPSSLLNANNNLTSNGTWSVGNNATNLAVDTFNFVTGGASLRFDTTGGGALASLENSTQQAVDVSGMEDVGALFLWVYMPTIVTDVTLRWGSSSANYWSRVATTGQASDFVVGWNLIRFDWDVATQVGNPDSTDITYLKITLTTDGVATNNYRIDSLVVQVGQIYLILYYSKCLFTNNITGAYQETVQNDDDAIVLDIESRNLLLYKCADLASQQISGADAGFDTTYFGKRYQEMLESYRAQSKTEALKPRVFYYTPVANVRGKRVLTP